MKQTILVSATAFATALVFLAIGIICGRDVFHKKCTRKHQNIISDSRIVLIPVGDVDGRPKFNVLFSDEEGIDSMYPEEIGNGLLTGDWDYNEMLTIKEIAE